MAMEFQFNVHPFGQRRHSVLFARFYVHSDGPVHRYEVSFKSEDGWRAFQGSVPKVIDNKKRSGHRNFLHMLQDILNDMDLEELGENYVHILQDIREEMGMPELMAGDYCE